MMRRLQVSPRTLIGVALLMLVGDTLIVFFRIIGLSRETAIYAALLTITILVMIVVRRWTKPRTHIGDPTMTKRQLLPQPADSQKREVSVNLRFSSDVHERLKALAEFSGTTVAGLLFYVTVNTTLPMMEKEMSKAQQPAPSRRDSSPPTKPIPEVPLRPSQE